MIDLCGRLLLVPLYFSGYNTFKISERAKERVIGIFGGSILSGLLLLLIPINYLGMLGGICLGFCAYKNKTILIEQSLSNIIWTKNNGKK
ncbi:hypothetical protein [Streptococcus lutetiensis]|uniref:hypothetical protein n=1 Tax=Streptococcus lutetiensis TaxID=150055 RepID=UPI0010FF2B75|nr:hypothetical protein [Streptococcus lutetiensis]